MPEQAISFDDSAAYERFMGQWSRAVAPVFLDWLSAPPAARWLEAGCGTGVFTGLIVDRCAPASVSAIDPSAEQVAHARRLPLARITNFQVADAQSLPYPDAAFDVVTSALTINFIPDRARALAEMRRVACAGGSVSGYVWDFAPECSPSGPLRLGMKRLGMTVPDIPGSQASGLTALAELFGKTGFEEIDTKTIEVTVPYPDFDAFWRAQTPNYAPWTRLINALPDTERGRLAETVRAALPVRADGSIAYAARANAIKARVPG